MLHRRKPEDICPEPSCVNMHCKMSDLPAPHSLQINDDTAVPEVFCNYQIDIDYL